MSNRFVLILIIVLLLSSCGGGSSSNSRSSQNTPDSGSNTVTTGIIPSEENAKVNQSIALFLYYPQDSISNIHWQQTSGETLIFHANSSKAIAFTPKTSGDYSIQVSFNRNGVTEQLTHNFSVTDESSSLTVRLGHAVLEGNKVSLRVHFNDNNISSDSITWQQISGTSVSITAPTTGEKAIYFDAPSVVSDQLISFQATASNGNEQFQDTVTILVENAPEISTDEDTLYENRLARVFPFNANSPYADVIVDCVYSNNMMRDNTCRFNVLPLIAQETLNPTVEDIMDRVVVSHYWMGQRFKEFLENYDNHNDFKNLLRATTAIVISYDIRPSYYWVVSGAIHLDPDNLWLTPDERDTINQTPDYRSSFGDSLSFVMPWRYVKDNDYASYYYSTDSRAYREADEGLYRLTSLMYHELAHANDFFPRSSWQNLNRNDKILDAANKIFNATGIQSDLLANAYPLHGNEMYRLAEVRYQGETATSAERNYSPSDVTSFFSPEHAPQFYNYSSKREDYAMLFDGFMMKARYNVDRDVAITNQPQSEANSYIVNWGQRGRMGENNIKPRVEFVVTRVLPEFTQASSIIDALNSPIMMEAGKTWQENLAISPEVGAKKVTQGKKINSPDIINAEGEHYIEKPLLTFK